MKKGPQNVDNSSKRPEKRDSDIFHSIVAKLLWVEKRGRPNIETSIPFLCTRVTKITKEDKEKSRCVLKYLKHTIDDKRIMRADMTIPENARTETRNTTTVIPSHRTLPTPQHRMTSPKTSVCTEEKTQTNWISFLSVCS